VKADRINKFFQNGCSFAMTERSAFALLTPCLVDAVPSQEKQYEPVIQTTVAFPKKLWAKLYVS
jgi:hypothetical protein